jgi:hypothetical protein
MPAESANSVAATRLRKPFVMALLLVVLLLSWTRVVDQPAADYLDGALKRTLVTFAIARALNGSISMLQDADLSVSPVGVGVTLSPGELLDPINDLIEQFSSILLLASISLGAQKILLAISGAKAVSALLSVLLIGAGLLWWRGAATALRTAALRAAAIMLLLRFFVPLYAVASHTLDHYFLEPRFAEASAALDLSRAEAEAATQEPAAAAPSPLGLSERLAGWFREAGESLDIRARVDNLLQRLSAVSEHIVTLCVVFLMQSVVLPLLFVSLAGYALRSIWQLRPDGDRKGRAGGAAVLPPNS